LATLGLWQAALAVAGHTDTSERKRVLERIGSAARAVVYLVLAVSAGKSLVGSGSNSSQKQQGAASGVMSHGWGVWLVALVGIAIVGGCVAMAWYGVTAKFEEKLHTEKMSRKSHQTTKRLGQVGYVAKALAYGIVGGLLVDAAVTHNPNKSGLDAALRTLAEHGYGKIVLIVIAAGFALFGVFCCFQARFRKVGT
jgi:uncharacterized membrane protein YbjE (DUF340 family)